MPHPVLLERHAALNLYRRRHGVQLREPIQDTLQIEKTIRQADCGRFQFPDSLTEEDGTTLSHSRLMVFVLVSTSNRSRSRRGLVTALDDRTEKRDFLECYVIRVFVKVI